MKIVDYIEYGFDRSGPFVLIRRKNKMRWYTKIYRTAKYSQQIHDYAESHSVRTHCSLTSDHCVVYWLIRPGFGAQNSH